MIIKMIGTELSPQSVSDMYYMAGVIPVSYTHLDVYKRQALWS